MEALRNAIVSYVCAEAPRHKKSLRRRNNESKAVHVLSHIALKGQAGALELSPKAEQRAFRYGQCIAESD
jgi:hypothetical protein